MNFQQRRSHVPKFGSWDVDNGPYSGHFESARKERGTVVGMNLYDTQENPEAFAYGEVGPGNGVHFNFDKSEPAERNPTEGLWKDNGSLSHRSMASETGSDKNSSDYSLQQRNHRQTRSARKKSMTEINNFAPPLPGSGGFRSASKRSDDNDANNRTASVPKFGAWDEMDSSEGYTVIFDKVKEEKQNAATKFTAGPAKPSNPKNSQNYKRTRPKVRIQSN
ncbi:hypothetical protein Vadar_008314 [Vaccinium darrowii]|uniref:Uncharacterized protein n=1 Tax=Vaccinium darrowii TaxID=229202 RepID=A0ACB7X8I3_9ERIC|nr:hypothetical protein Vadar_008314 [Vaccinium darrowii]